MQTAFNNLPLDHQLALMMALPRVALGQLLAGAIAQTDTDLASLASSDKDVLQQHYIKLQARKMAFTEFYEFVMTLPTTIPGE